MIIKNAQDAPDHIKRELAESRKVSRLLTEPLDAFAAAWRKRSGLPVVRDARVVDLRFGGILRSHCASDTWDEMATLSGRADSALSVFLDTVNLMLDLWMPASPDSVAWCFANPKAYEDVKSGQLSRRTAVTVPDAFTQLAMDGRSTLIRITKFLGQTTYKQAATTAALVLFGDFLVDSPGTISFCKKCSKPYLFRSNKEFCSGDCARGITSNRSHKADTASETKRGS